MGDGEYWAIKPASDTQSASHALARPIVVWNLRNAFDRLAASAGVFVLDDSWGHNSHQRREGDRERVKCKVT